MESNLDDRQAVQPVRPVAAYLGGKRNLSKRLVPLIDQTPHRAYAEPFVGMGGVFLRRTTRPRSEVINDINGDVATFFRVLQRHYTAFMEMMRFQISTRAEFDRLSKTDPVTLTDLERAARFLYLQRTAFGGKVVGRSFGVSPGLGGRFNILTIGPMLEELHERLAGVVIEQLDWQAFLARYDRAETLFYLDPPYHRGEGDYGPGVFDNCDFARMADLLTELKGRFILSINDTPEMREVFGRFNVLPVATTYTIQGGPGRRAKELIIRDK